MKKISGLILICFLAFNSKASHKMGGELTYRWIDSISVEFTYSFYRDCAGISAPTSVYVNGFSSSCGANLNITLPMLPGSGQEVSMACNSVLTTCQGGTFPGVQEYKYQTVYTIPPLPCPDWEFSVSICCRNNAITTLVAPGTKDMQIKTSYNALNGLINSSPVFNTPPYFILYNNNTYNLDCSATDYDGDSISYKMVNPLSGNMPIAYNAPYSASNPFASPNFNLDNNTGMMTVETEHSMVTVLSMLVEEFRNGQLIGSVMRDYQVMVLPDTMANQTPSISGMNNTSDDLIIACLGDTIDFDIFTSDPDLGDSLEVTVLNNINGAVLNWTAGNLPVGSFSWIPGIADVDGLPYVLQVMVEDQACPIRNKVFKSYTIYVSNCDTANVWPGDANHDFVADVFDIIPLGIAMGTQGQPRAGANISWTAQPASNWGNTLPNGIDYKHADCDGDGLVDTIDAMAIFMNYGQAHPKPGHPDEGDVQKNSSRDSELELYLDPQMDVTTGEAIYLPLYLGSSSFAAQNILALAMSINYDPEMIESGSVEFISADSWIGENGNDLFVMSRNFPIIGQLDVGITRLVNESTTGYGLIGYLNFKTNNTSLTLAQLNFEFGDAKLANNSGNDIQLNTGNSSINIGAVSIEDKDISAIRIFPNPVKDVMY
ncbi:MAG TPA: hypothetical protein EYQ86_08005, partial [Bacteroidetes bacterium]|nr:hypothetical protein [Bacteroidota bacterium]